MKIIKFFAMFFVCIAFIACGESGGKSTDVQDDHNSPLTGSGTEADPYQIADGSELELIVNDLSAVYRLTADITLTGEWVPIGTYIKPFSGTLHGGGHKITGLYIDSDRVHNGLFGVIMNGSADRLIIEYKTMTSSNKYGYVGALAGWTEGAIIDNISVKPLNVFTDNISCTGENCFAGGLIADAQNSIITAVYTTGNINSGFFAGGIVGLAANNSIIRASYAAGTIHSRQRAGGVANYVVDGSVVEHSAYLGTSITGTYIGRIVDDHDIFTINVLNNNYASDALPGTWKNNKNDTDGMGVPPESFKNPLWYGADTLPWLSSGVWKIDPAKNNSLPVFSWE